MIAHFFEGKDIKKSIPELFKKFQGEFAVLLMKKGDDKIYAFKRGSPLVLGIGNDFNIISCDIYGFSDKTNKILFLNEDDFLIVSSSN